jgi:hypothetical protein
MLVSNLTMIKQLEKALSKLGELSELDQEAIANRILAEIEDEKLWDQQFQESQDQLAKLAEEALADFKQGKTLPLEF